MANTTYDTIKNMKPAPWSRSTVADGNALNQNFLEPTHQKDLTLAAAIDQVKNTVDGYNETINTINGIANNAKDMATEAISDVNEVSTTVEEHQEALITLDYNVNSLSSSMVEVVTDITNLENNKQDKIYVDPTTIAGSGTQDSPYTVIGGGSGGSNKVYIPEVDESTGELSYVLSSTSGAQSPLGPWHVKPLIRIATESKEWEISYDGGTTWENTHINAEGIPGYSPTFEIENIPESQEPDAQHKNGGTKITIKYGDGEYDTTSYSAWNGNDGSMANAPDIEGTNGLSASFNGSKYFVGLSGEMEVGKVYAITTSGVEEMPIEYSADGRLCSIGEDNKFVYVDGGMNDTLLQGYANSGTYEDFVQGYGNSGLHYTLVQGRANKARMNSLAQGYQNNASGSSFAQGNENIAEVYALAQGYSNSALHHSLAQGYENTASNYSLAQGTNNIALSYSLSQGAGNRAETYSIAQGQGNRAFENSQAFGLSTIASGSSIDGHHYGMMSIGSYNATTAGALFVVGNGYSENSTDYRSDAFIVYKDGHVSATGDIWANGVKLGAGGSFTGVTTTGSISGDGLTNPLGLKTSAEQALNIAQQLTPPENTSMVRQWLWQNTTPGHPTTPSGWVNATDVISDAVSDGIIEWMDSYLDDWVTNGIGLSANWVGEEGYEKYTFGVDTTNMAANKQYAFTTTGWEEVQTGGGTVYDIIGNNGISAKKDTTNDRYEVGLSGSYLPTSGGTVSGDVVVSATGTCLLAVGTEATLMGQSRVANLGDTTARGTNWLGVTQSNQGFLKYVNGGNVGALNGTSIQINFAPDGANSYGNITVNSQDNMSKVVHVPTASYDSMTTFDPTNGPNYMLRKTASGFDIGAKVVNVTSMPQNTEANTYYFVYEV